MLTNGDKLLFGFLTFSIVFYLASLQFGGDTPVHHHGESMADTETSTARHSPDTTELLPGNSSLGSYDLKSEAATRWKLPKRLQEISGLAMTDDNRLLGHNDEQGVVFDVDYRDGSIVKAFGLGDLKKPISGDFEGIAVTNDTIYLVTSTGRIYECREGADGETVPFTVHTTGVGREYEIEGLAYDPDQRALLIMSKNPLGRERKGKLTIYRWSLDTRQLVEGGHTVIPIKDFAQHIKGKKFQPSGIERNPQSGNYFIVAARQSAIAEITPTGQVVAVAQFPAKRHPQMEGITFSPDNRIIVSDEGAVKHARLTLYRAFSN